MSGSTSTLVPERCLFPNTESSDSIPDDIKQKLAVLQASGVKIMPYKKVAKISEDTSGDLVVHISDGSTYIVSWILYKPKKVLSTQELVTDLGLEMTLAGDIKIDGMFQQTSVPGVFAAGDCATMLKQIPMAVSQGAIAGTGIHFTLAMEDAEKMLKFATT
jgi:gliotoxin/aspirochlorine biosynthesis thioredoxin reductase